MLKRLYPDTTPFLKKILKLDPPIPQHEEDVHNNDIVRFKGPVMTSQPNNNPTAQPQPQPQHNLPDTFRGSNDMLKWYTPLLLKENVASNHREFELNSGVDGVWNRPTFVMTLKSITKINPQDTPAVVKSTDDTNLYECTFEAPRTNKQMPPQSCGNLFAMHCDLWKSTNTNCCLGLLARYNNNNYHTTMFESDNNRLEVKLWICVSSSSDDDDEGGRNGWLHQSDLPSIGRDGTLNHVTVHILNVGTVETTLREYEGIKSISLLQNSIKRTIFCKKTSSLPPPLPLNSNKADETHKNNKQSNKGEEPLLLPPPSKKTFAIRENSDTSTIGKPPSIPLDVWENLKSSLNIHQLQAIQTLMKGKSKQNMMLLQGPPGTGKSSTIVGLVSALLNGSCAKPGGKAGGVKIRIGKSLSTEPSSQDGNAFGVVPQDQNSPIKRILVCAPSNAAVDSLAWKIYNSSIGPYGKVGEFKMARYGALPGEGFHNNNNGGKRNKKSSSKTNKNKLSSRDEFLRDISVDSMVDSAASAVHRGGVNYGRIRRNILSKCHVVCTTLSGAGSKVFINAVRNEEYSADDNSAVLSEFDAVIIDEACQASETSCLVPLKYNPKCVVLVGDPKQLPVLVLSQQQQRLDKNEGTTSSTTNFGRSLFQRLQENDWPVHMLLTQYRMHQDIAYFPSAQFYDGKLVASRSVQDRKPTRWYSDEQFPPFLIWNSKGKMQKSQCNGVVNIPEVTFIAKLLLEFQYACGDVTTVQIGVIAFYSEQVQRLQRAIQSSSKLSAKLKSSIQVSTVDGFQGAEKDIIILSCVRSKEDNNYHAGIGFLQDYRRLNVALTRARLSLYIVGNCKVLSKDCVWKGLIDFAKGRKLVKECEAFQATVEQASENNPVDNLSESMTKMNVNQPMIKPTKTKKNGRRKHRSAKTEEEKIEPDDLHATTEQIPENDFVDDLSGLLLKMDVNQPELTRTKTKKSERRKHRSAKIEEKKTAPGVSQAATEQTSENNLVDDLSELMTKMDVNQPTIIPAKVKKTRSRKHRSAKVVEEGNLSNNT